MPPQPIPQHKSLDSISVWALLATLAAILFVFTPSASVALPITKSFVVAAGTLITLALYILARLSRGNVIFPPAVLLVALWLPTIAYGLSSVFSGIPFANALWGSALEPDTFGFMLSVASLGTLAALILRRPEQYQAFLGAAAYAFGLFVVLQALAVIVGQFAPNVVSPMFSFLGSLGDTASLSGLGIILILLSLRFLDLSGKAQRNLLIVGLLALALLAVANSSIVWTLLALVALGLFVESVMRRGARASDADLEDALVVNEAPVDAEEGNRSLVYPLVVLAVSLFFLIGGTLGGALANALNVNVLDIRPSWQSTLSVARQSYGSSAVFGSGPSTFGAEWLKYRSAALNSTIFWGVDFSSGIGFVPTAAVTTGVLGLIAWLSFFGLFVVFGLRMLLARAPQDAFVRFVSIASFVGALYLFAIAVFDLPGVFVLALAFVLAGLFASTMRFAQGGAQWGVIFARSPRVGFVIVFSLTILLLSSVVVAYSLVGRYVAAVGLARANDALSAGNLDAADAAAQSSISFAPSAAAYQMQAAIANARLATIAASTTMERTAAQQAYQAALSSGINAALTATNLNGSDYRSWIALGNLYAQAVPLNVSGAYDSAKTAYEKAKILNPTNPQIPYILAQLDIAHKDTKGAEENLKAAIALKQDYTAAIFLLSQLEVQDGNVKEALNSALAAAYFSPNDPNVLFQVGILYAAQNDLANAAAALSAAIAANPQFANARYFLSAVYAKQGSMENALKEMQTIADMSPDNAKAVETQLAALKNGKNPFPANLLTITPEPVKQ